MTDFEYEAPTDLKELSAKVAEYGEKARILAGGTDLIDHIRTGRFSPDVVIDIKKIPEMNELSFDDSGLTVGAAVPCSRIYEHTDAKAHFGALIDATSIIGGIQIQNRATLGGNLCTSSPAADSIPALIALNAVCVLQGRGGTQQKPIHDFCTGPGRNVLSAESAGDVLVSIKIPRPAARTGSHYRRFIPRNEMDIAVVGVGASLQLSEDGEQVEQIRIALGAVAPIPLLVGTDELVGMKIDSAIAKAVEIARSVASPIDDMRGTREFRLHVVGVLVERVLNECVERAKPR
ncbi:MAG: xanthine dehydrogenase family protein subunit M [Planctomycetaceae bacterium]